jgi:hypothetical protein
MKDCQEQQQGLLQDLALPPEPVQPSAQAAADNFRLLR